MAKRNTVTISVTNLVATWEFKVICQSGYKLNREDGILYSFVVDRFGSHFIVYCTFLGINLY